LSRKGLVSELLTSLLIGLAIGYFVSPRTDTSRLEREIENLETQLADKESQVTTLQLQLANIEKQLETRILGVYFSPKGGCEDQVIYWISRANKSVHVLIYSFTLDSIGDALMDAYIRGIDIKVVFEKNEIDSASEYQELEEVGMNVRADTNPKLMHDKVMIIDSQIVLTGSFNWSENGEENNNENLIIIKGVYVAEIYEEEFEEIWRA